MARSAILPVASKPTWPAGHRGHQARAEIRPKAAEVQDILILVVDGFSLMSLSGLIEPLKQANDIAQQGHFRWRTIGIERAQATSSSGISVKLDGCLGEQHSGSFHGLPATILICAGEDVENHASWQIRSFLHRMKRWGVSIGGVGTGAWLVADAGLLAGRDCTIHWSKIPAFAEKFRDARIDNRLIQQDENIYTCAGEMAAFDMSIGMINRIIGHETGRRVSNHFVTDLARAPNDRQRLPKALKYRTPGDPMVRAIALMESNIATPKTMGEIATQTGLSRRQLERLFKQHLDSTPYHYYLTLRLDWARDLLRQTRIPITEVAIASGFTSTSQFSKSFKDAYACRPSDLRQISAV
ncbi:GlxA family transcriptional regulator [Aminobacter sp. AP02]|uniref:GlxA family transcriptional regulator n=1 Tax=Aminobacter sp. AP02 TaxID=2135737 RepID=UPI000D6B6062|nr:GlxA family transcriptional regulator [Aminobacter sp. AP02]PWK76918.1 AraC family transcriptional regulator with amidase-like domain [Aminobacter sp. AP02]